MSQNPGMATIMPEIGSKKIEINQYKRNINLKSHGQTILTQRFQILSTFWIKGMIGGSKFGGHMWNIVKVLRNNRHIVFGIRRWNGCLVYVGKQLIQLSFQLSAIFVHFGS